MTDTFQWERCDADGASCVDISGATSSTYTLVSDDVDHTIRVKGYRDAVLVGESDPTNVVTATAPSLGTLLFDDGFPTENASFTAHWNGIQQKTSGRVTLVTSPVDGQSKAAHFVCQAGDNNVAGSGTGERAEILRYGGAIGGSWGTEGSDQYTAMSVYFATGFPYFTTTLWNYFAQWHANAGGTQASAFSVYNNQIVCVTNGGTSLTAKPFNRATIDTTFDTGKWLEFIVHHHWSSTAAGYFDVYYRKDGSIRDPKRVSGPNLYSTDTGRPYPKIGVYRAAGLSADSVLTYGQYKICASLSDAQTVLGW